MTKTWPNDGTVAALEDSDGTAEALEEMAAEATGPVPASGKAVAAIRAIAKVRCRTKLPFIRFTRPELEWLRKETLRSGVARLNRAASRPPSTQLGAWPAETAAACQDSRMLGKIATDYLAKPRSPSYLRCGHDSRRLPPYAACGRPVNKFPPTVGALCHELCAYGQETVHESPATGSSDRTGTDSRRESPSAVATPGPARAA
jgi:hypothetical protein